MKDQIKEFRDGIFALRTRRFGTVAELMIQKLYNLSKAENQFHDLYNTKTNQRVEVKFSTVMKSNESVIEEDNLIDQCLKANLANRSIFSKDILNYDYDCNIQQVKRKEFDFIYYGLFFADKIVVFGATSEDVLKCPNYSDFQHKGNEGEGQFHLNLQTIPFHLKNNLIKWITYEDLFDAFK